MDVERIQKINNLALDLMKQGLAADRDDAIAQAEKIFSDNKSEEYNSMKETMEEIKEDHKPEQSKEGAVSLSQDEIKEILEKNSNFMVKTIKTFQERIHNLEKEMSSLRTKLNYKELPTVKDIVQPKEVEEINLDEEKVEEKIAVIKEESPVEKKKESHPRVGLFEDTDVSIEKFFYMGNK